MKSLKCYNGQDTIKSPPPEKKSKKKATLIGIGVTTVFYMSIGCVGYAAFGNNAPGNMLTGFGFYEPFWLIDIGNLCIVIHMIGAYQVFSQPLFAFIEGHISRKWPMNDFVNRDCVVVRFGLCGGLSLSMLRVVLRSSIVVSTTVIAMALPFFNEIMGLIGAIGFWPLTVYYPLQMYMAQSNVRPWSGRWILMQCLSIVCLVVTILAMVGSTAGIVQDLRHIAPFQTTY